MLHGVVWLYVPDPRSELALNHQAVKQVPERFMTVTVSAPSPVPAEPSKTEEAQRQIAQPTPKPKRSRVKRRRARKKRAKRPRKAIIKEIEPTKPVTPKQVIAQVQPQAAAQESPVDSAPSTQRDDESKAPTSATSTTSTSTTSTTSSASHGDGSSGQPPKRRLSRSQLRGIAKGYYRSLNMLMKQKRVYPRSARRLKLEGTVLVEMVINREGEIIKVRVARSSGHELLDKAAIAQVQKLRRVPKIPRELNRPSMTFKIPFDYRLQS
jgi:protein TonB